MSYPHQRIRTTVVKVKVQLRSNENTRKKSGDPLNGSEGAACRTSKWNTMERNGGRRKSGSREEGKSKRGYDPDTVTA